MAGYARVVEWETSGGDWDELMGRESTRAAEHMTEEEYANSVCESLARREAQEANMVMRDLEKSRSSLFLSREDFRVVVEAALLALESAESIDKGNR